LNKKEDFSKNEEILLKNEANLNKNEKMNKSHKKSKHINEKLKIEIQILDTIIQNKKLQKPKKQFIEIIQNKKDNKELNQNKILTKQPVEVKTNEESSTSNTDSSISNEENKKGIDEESIKKNKLLKLLQMTKMNRDNITNANNNLQIIYNNEEYIIDIEPNNYTINELVEYINSTFEDKIQCVIDNKKIIFQSNEFFTINKCSILNVLGFNSQDYKNKKVYISENDYKL
jgi:hypothetical protein